MWQQGGMGSQLDCGANDDISANMRALADFSRFVDDRRRMDAGSISGRLVETGQCARESQIRVLEAQGWRANLRKIRLYQHRHGFGRTGQCAVPGVGHEGHLRRSRLLNTFDSSHFQLRVSTEFRAQSGCQFA